MHTQNTMPHDFQDYIYYLQSEERSPGTIANNLRHLRAFARWLDGAPVEKSSVVRWKTHLLAAGYTPATINGMLASLHSYFHFRGWAHCRVRYLRVQRKLFRADDRALSRAEYQHLLRTARARGWRQLALVVETLGATGIRVSELSAITVEAVRRGRADIHLKGKIRTILIPARLCDKLRQYARQKKIIRGEIFLTADGKSMSRYQVWADMKRLAVASHVAPSKVFPHNLRHLFATVFYDKCHDIARLADMLGHSSIETTRIYLAAPDNVCRQQLESLRLVE